METKAYKYRIYPTKAQEEQILRTFGCCRYVFNYFLAKKIVMYEDGKNALSYKECSAEMTVMKQELEWLKEPDSTALQSSLKDLDAAYQNFFRRVKRGESPGFPRFKKKKGNSNSYQAKFIKNNIAVFEKHIKLPKLGEVKASISQQVQGKILNATVSQTPSGKYFVSICCADVYIPQCESTGADVGVNLGLRSIAATSDGFKYPNHRHLNKSMKKLAREQRRLSRKQIGSKNREKARIKVARIHEDVANRRKDAIHKMTTELVRNYDTIIIKDLDVRGMSKNPHLAGMIKDSGWGEIRRQLTYKTMWQRKSLVVIDKLFPTSQLCHQCGHKNAAVKNLSVRYWTCPSCKCEHDREINAASNILRAGLRLSKTA